MAFLKNIRERIGTGILKRKIKRRSTSRVVCNINDAKTIGIVFDATHQINFEIVKRFVKDQIDPKTEVSVIGYVHTSKLNDHYLYRKGYDFFTCKNLGVFFTPKLNTVEAFINKPFDLLINLSLENYFPIQYIVGLSNAKFKAGRYIHNEKYLDLMIVIDKEIEQYKQLQEEIKALQPHKKKNTAHDKEMALKAENEIHLNFLIEQLVHYLKIMKKNINSTAN